MIYLKWRSIKMNNLIISLGGCGTNIIKAAAESPLLDGIKMYAIDSVTSTIDLSIMDRIKVIPIIADEKTGSGRNRERGKDMFEFHESQGAFEEMYSDAVNSKSPILVITSAAGGTGSGSAIPVCKSLLDKGVQVIPIIICPNKNDPTAFHLNTNDLLMELGELGIKTYSMFENRRGDADYGPVNQEVVNLIEIIFGKKYGKTDLDSIDESDLDVILNTPGRFLAVSAEANSIPALRKEITRKVFSGFQPAWTPDEAKQGTILTGYSLTSMFANTDFGNVFEEINNRLDNVYDEYRNIVNDDNDGVSVASIIVAGLPRPQIKEIDNEYKEASGLGDGMKKSTRPNFMRKKKNTFSVPTDNGDNKAILNQVKWK